MTIRFLKNLVVLILGFTFFNSIIYSVSLETFTVEVLKKHPYIKSYQLKLDQQLETINKARALSDWNLSTF